MLYNDTGSSEQLWFEYVCHEHCESTDVTFAVCRNILYYLRLYHGDAFFNEMLCCREQILSVS